MQPRLRLLFILAFYLFVPAAASDEKGAIEEIIVYGEKLNRSLLTTHSSVYVQDEVQLQRSTDRDLNDVFERIPNVSVRGDTEQITVRGIPRGGFGGASSAVFYMIDGGLYSAALSRTGVPLWDLEQLEVIRGAQSTAPISTVGGIVALRTKSPTLLPEGRLKVSWIGEGNQQEVGLAVGGGLGTVATRLALHARKDDGFIENVRFADKDWNAEDRYLARGALAWSPGAETTLSFMFQRIEEDLDGADFVNRVLASQGFDPFDRQVDYGIPVFIDNTSNFSLVRLEHRLNDSWSTELVLTLQELTADSIWPVSTAASATAFNDRHLDVDLATIEWRAAYRSAVLDTHFSLYARDIDTIGHTDQIFFADFDGPGPLPGAQFTRRTNATRDRRLYSALIFGTYRPDDHWTIDAGLRLQQSRIGADGEGFFARLGSTGDPAADDILDGIVSGLSSAVGSSDPDYFDLLPILSVAYAIDAHHRLGVKVEKGVRPGDASLNQFQGLVFDYDQETALNAELFYRASLARDRVALRANLFKTVFDDQQVRACFGPQSTNCHVVNANESHARGVEIGVTWVINPAWEFEFGSGFLQTDFDDFQVGSIDWSGNEFPNAPDTTLSIAINYDTSSAWFWSADVTYESESFATAENVPTILREARHLVNTKLGRRNDGWTVTLFARNLLDEEFNIFINPDLPQGVFQLTDPGDPRQIGISMEYHWD